MKLLTKSLILLLSIVSFSGCTLWYNFTTYFNLYYNTELAFEQAQSQLNDLQKDPFVTYDVPIPASSLQPLDKVIEKCSKILQFNASSSYVDDALLMIGKAFFYQKNYVKALRKFDELISKRESDLVLEGELWRAMTLMQMKNSSAGLTELSAVRAKAVEQDDNKILSRAYVEEIRYYLTIEDYEKAIPLFKKLIDETDNNDLKARASYQVAWIYANDENYLEAAKYYKATYSEYSPTYEVDFNSRLRYGRMLLELDQADDALTIFQDLRSEDKFKEYRDQIDLAIALATAELGNYDEAFNMFRAFDTTYISSAQLGNSRYELANLYERLNNYDSAGLYYQKAISSSATVEYLPLIRERSQTFSKYTELRDYFNDHYTSYLYATDSTKFKEDSLKYYADTLSSPNTDSITVPATDLRSERERDFDNPTPPQNNQTMTPNPKKGQPPVRSPLTADSLKNLLAKYSFELANLFYTNLDVPDSAAYYYRKVIVEYQGSPYHARALYTFANYLQGKGDSLAADSIYHIVYNDHKSDRIVNEAAKKIREPEIDFEFDPAKQLYADAEQKLLKGEYNDAYNSFCAIYKTHPRSSLAPKALYASAFILEDKLKLGDSAAVIYDTLIAKFASTPYASAATPKLTFYKGEKERIKLAIEDSIRHVRDSLQAIRDSITNAEQRVIADSIAKFQADSIASADSSKIEPKEIPADSLEEKNDIQLEPVQQPQRQALSTDDRNYYYDLARNDLLEERSKRLFEVKIAFAFIDEKSARLRDRSREYEINNKINLIF